MIDRGTENLTLCLKNREARRHVQARGIATMTVDDQDAREAMMGQTATNILEIADKGVPDILPGRFGRSQWTPSLEVATVHSCHWFDGGIIEKELFVLSWVDH